MRVTKKMHGQVGDATCNCGVRGTAWRSRRGCSSGVTCNSLHTSCSCCCCCYRGRHEQGCASVHLRSRELRQGCNCS